MRTKLISLVCVVMFVASGILFSGSQSLAQGSSQKTPVKIGLITPLSGPAATAGGRIVIGFKIAQKIVNEKGGVLEGRPLELIVEDGKNDPTDAISAANKLIMRDKVVILVGAYHSSSTLAIMPITQEKKIPHLVDISSAAKITKMGHPYLFRIAATTDIEAQNLKPFFPLLGFKDVAFLPANTDWGRSIFQSFKEALEATGGRVVSVDYLIQGDVNFMAQLTKIKNSGADSFIVNLDVESLSSLLKQSSELGMKKMNRLSCGGSPGSIIVKLTGKVASEGLYVSEPYAPVTMAGGDFPENRYFSQLYQKEQPGEYGDYFGATGYICGNLIGDVLRRAKSDTPDAIRDAFKKTKYQSLRGLIEFDDYGQAHTPYVLSQVQLDGSQKRLFAKDLQKK